MFKPATNYELACFAVGHTRDEAEFWPEIAPMQFKLCNLSAIRASYLEYLIRYNKVYMQL